MEDFAGEKEVREQLKFENLVPEEKKTLEIIPILPGEFQPRKAEEVLPGVDILPDTYIIYPTGGYHPFYGVPNTFPIYQLPIWPYVERINYICRGRGPKKNMTNHNNSQANLFFGVQEYVMVSLKRSTYRTSYFTEQKKSRRVPKDALLRFHRVVALAWIPNPEKKKNVCHINDNTTNYLIENLKWGTFSENNRGKIQKRPDTMEQKYLNFVNRGIIKG
jgi:hypothetical protein